MQTAIVADGASTLTSAVSKVDASGLTMAHLRDVMMAENTL
jgi:hypothetical protein